MEAKQATAPSLSSILLFPEMLLCYYVLLSLLLPYPDLRYDIMTQWLLKLANFVS